MGLSVKPVTIRNTTYLQVPRDVAELLRVMASKICSVNLKIDEKECTLIYSFAKPVPTTTRPEHSFSFSDLSNYTSILAETILKRNFHLVSHKLMPVKL